MAPATAEAAPPPTQRLELVPLDRLIESPANHRKKTWGDMKELTESVKAKGVLQPILARPVKGIGSNLLEIVFGHRRHRAAKAAGLATIPTVIRELTDVEALEANVIENLQRADVHPLEEAEGYEGLVQPAGPYSVDEIAAKVGKSKAYVYGRMKLLALCPEARKAFYAEKITPSVALLIARIPVPELQEQALEEVSGDPGCFVDPMSHGAAQDLILDRYTLRLKDAPFDLADGDLVAGAGSCAACPKRSGAQPELFADVVKDRGDVCTDPACFADKKKAAWKRTQVDAKAKGLTLLTEAQAKRVFDHAGRVWEWGSHVDLTAKCADDPKKRTWKQLLDGQEVEKVLARDARGKVHTLLPKAAAAAALKQAGHKFKVAERYDGGHETKEDRETRQAKEKAERVQEELITHAIVEEMLSRRELRKQEGPFWRLVVEALMDVDEEVMRRRLQIPEDRSVDVKAVDSYLDKLGSTDLQLLVFELALQGQLYTPDRWDRRSVGKKLRAWLQVDEKAIRKRVIEEQKAKAAKAEPLDALVGSREDAVKRHQASKAGGTARGSTGAPRASGAGSLAWSKSGANDVADVDGGVYCVEPPVGVSGDFGAFWTPTKGSSKRIGIYFTPAAAREACAAHHIERCADQLLKNSGDGELTKASLKGDAVARKKGR